MQAIILNSGLGSRLGKLAPHKCLVEPLPGRPMFAEQLRALRACGIRDILMTTGHQSGLVEATVRARFPDLDLAFVGNPIYPTTNYIYSLFLASAAVREDLILLHGDLYFEAGVLADLCRMPGSRVAIDACAPRSPKDFKAQLVDGRIRWIGTRPEGAEAVECQPLYKLQHADWQIWSAEIARFCESGRRTDYAEEALNVVLGDFALYPFDLGGRLCTEIDTPDDLDRLRLRLAA